jgi:cell division protease FtsH
VTPAHNGTAATLFRTNRPTFADDHLLTQLMSRGVVVSAKPINTGQSPWVMILGGVLPTLLLVRFWVWIMQSYAGKMGQGAGMFGMGPVEGAQVRGHRPTNEFR